MSISWAVSLGRFSTGLNLTATFLDTAGIEVGTAVVEELGNGRYIITEDVPTGAAIIAVRDTDRDAVVQVGAVGCVAITITDSLTVADSAAFTHCMTLADAVVLIDTDAFMHLLTIADAVGLAEADTYRHDVAPADSVTLSEAIALLHRLGVADAVKLSPSVSFVHYKDRDVTVTDALVCRDGITLTKLLTVQDLVLLRQLVRAITPCSGGYFENPSGSCAGAYREDDDQQSNLYQEMV